MTSLLSEGIENHFVEKTTISRKMTIDGIPAAYPVYRVRLDQLYYNDQNDRIATWISKYKAEHGGKMPDKTDIESYNNVIEKFIVESNPDAIKKTQKNIELFEQREPGVVLNDGRIIDGNRRFTCLRRLSKENPKFNYFETVILDRDITTNAKAIKLLELSIQHGEEEKVDYDPVDRLVGVYNDIIDSQLLTVEEYAQSTNESVNDVKKRVQVSQLMVDFLEYIGAPKEFYIARDLQIDGPLEELPAMLKKCATEDEKEDLKISAFTNILAQPSGDMTRFVRKFKKVVGTNLQNEFLAEQKDLAEKVINTIPADKEVTTSVIRDTVRANDDIEEELNRSLEKYVEKSNKKQTLVRPIKLVESAGDQLENIDVNIFKKMDKADIDKLKMQLNRTKELLSAIEDGLNGMDEA